MELRDKKTGEIISHLEFFNIHARYISFPELNSISEELFNDYGYDVIHPATVPSQTTSAQEVIRDGIVEVDGKFYENYTIKLRDISLEQYKQEKKAELANARYREETGSVKFNSYTIATDRESRAVLDSTLDKFERGMLSGEIVWKVKDGWITLTKESIESIVLLIVEHVKNCYAKEKMLCEVVDNAKTFEEIAIISWS